MAAQRTSRRAPLVGALMAVLVGAGCIGFDDPGGETGVMLLLFGPDTVFVEMPSGNVTGASLAISQDLTFGAEFFTEAMNPDGRVNEQTFRLDFASIDTTLLQTSRLTPFSGVLDRRAAGQTELHFGLWDLEFNEYLFTVILPVTVN